MRATIIVLITLLLSACSSGIEGSRYAQLQPKFDPYTFFQGDIKAWGIVQDRDGNMIQQFVVDINAYQNESGQLVLDETFEYMLGDGVKERVWKIRQQQNGSYVGRAGDILAEASGETYGNAMNWRYEMDLPVGDTSYVVTFDDWMWAFDNNTLMNRSYIEKFGLTMAEVTIFMQKQ